MRKTTYIFRNDWKFAVKLIVVMFVVCGMSATCGAAWMWHSISVSHLPRLVRLTQVGAMRTPQVRVDNDAVATAIEQALQGERQVQFAKALQQLQEQMSNTQKDVRNIADGQAVDRTNVNRRIDIDETRVTTSISLLTILGTLIACITGILVISEFRDRRRALDHEKHGSGGYEG